ncbi:MAG: tetratricopeptide repeat protein [Treponema sp.]|jgi:tetratricopeptide (TPR) repeat protein|nr:tetratricopeptide repeat protein [Treponema sp.]
MADKLIPGPGEGNGFVPEASGGGRLKEGIRLFRLKRWDLALKELLQAAPENFSPEESRELAYYLGLCHAKLGRFEDALLYLEQVIATGGDVLRVYQCRMTLAYIYLLTRRSKMAEFELQRLQNNGIESPQLYTTLAYAAWLQKRWKKAIDFYERALELDENNTTAMNGLGYILADTSEDLIRGLRLCKRAVDRKPQNAAYLDSLGWAYYKSGEIMEARIWTRRALDAAPNEKEIKEHWQVVSRDQPGRRRG